MKETLCIDSLSGRCVGFQSREVEAMLGGQSLCTISLARVSPTSAVVPMRSSQFEKCAVVTGLRAALVSRCERRPCVGTIL